MRSNLKLLLIFVAGLFIGALITFILVGRLLRQQYADNYVLSVMEKAFWATELRAHHQDDLGKRLEALLPEGVLTINQHKETIFELSSALIASQGPQLIRHLATGDLNQSCFVPADAKDFERVIPDFEDRR